MKHFIITLVMALVAFVSASAQWSSQTTKADDFLGTKEVTTSAFLADNGDTFAFQGDKVIIQLRGRIFESGYTHQVPTLVGFIKDGEVVEKYNTTFAVSNREPSMALCHNRKFGKQIIDWLKEGGSIRIYAKTYRGKDYDVMIPKYNI